MNYKLSSAVIGILCFSREPYYVPPSQSPFCPQVWSRVWCKCSHLLNPVPGALSSLLSSEQRAPSSLLSGLGPALRISFLMSSLPAPLGLGVLASSSLSLRTWLPVLLCVLPKDQHRLFHVQFWPSGLQHELGPMALPLQSNPYAYQAT